MQLCVAGHPLPVRIGADGGSAFVGAPGMAVGLVTQIELEEVEVLLDPGDELVFYTDGVTERRSGIDQFGDENVLLTLSRCAGMTARQTAERLRTVVTDFGAEPLRDDLAVLVVRNHA